MEKRVLLALVAVALAMSASAQKVKLTVWGQDLLDGQANHAYVTSLVGDFQRKDPEIAIDYIALGGTGLMDRTRAAMASGYGLPDIFQTRGGPILGGYADAGRLMDLTADLASVPGSAAARDAMSWKGKLYGVAPFFAVAGVFVNDGILKANGLTPPRSVEDFDRVATALQAKGIQPFACGEADRWPGLALYMYLTDRYDGGIFTLAAARRARFDAEPFVKAAQLYQRWVRKGYFGAAPLDERYTDAQQLMGTGKAVLQVTGSWLCAPYSNRDFTDQDLGFYAFPRMKGAKDPAPDVIGMTEIGFAATMAAQGKRDAVVRFLRYAMSRDAAAVEPGRVSSVPGVKAPSPLTGMASTVFRLAPSVQPWWDQSLPPAVTASMNETVRTFFLPDTDVKASLTKLEDLATRSMGAVKLVDSPGQGGYRFTGP